MWEGTLRPKTNSHQPKNSPPSYRKRKWCHSTVSLIIAISAQVGHASAFLATRSPATSMPILRHADVYKSKNHLGRVHVKSKQSWYRPATSLRYASVFQSIPISWFYLCALAIQFGIQPLLTKAYAPSGIIRSTFVMAQDLVRFFTCWLTLVVGGTWHLAVQNWSWQGALVAAGIPSVLYMIQNYFTLIAYQALPPVTFNILNQTKTLSAALCCYLILGQKQSTIQIMALFLLLLSALVIEKIVPLPWIDSNKSDTTETESSQTKDDNKRERKIAAGVVPVLIASFISGLAGAVTQKSLQVLGHNAYVFNMELSAISMMIMFSTLLLGSPDGRDLWKSGAAKGWTWRTWIPVFTNAVGGVLVGLVTQHLGAVRKGFALILGLFLSGVLQSCFLSEEGISSEQIYGGVLASMSMWMHSKFAPI